MPSMSQTNLTHQLKKGFTLVEMLVIAPILILAIGGFIVVLISMVGDALKSRDNNALVYNTQASLDRIEQDIRLGVQFGTTTGTLPSPQGSDSNFTGTAAFTSTAGALIISSLSTDRNPGDGAREIVYYENQPNACGANQNYNTPFISTVVYYVYNNALYRRVLVPTYTLTTGQLNTVCDAPWQQNSCSPGYVSAQCQTQDAKLMDDVSSLSVAYYSSPSSSTDLGAANATAAVTVGVTINSTKTSAGQPISNTAAVRATKINSSSVATPQQLYFTTHPSSKTVAVSDTNITFNAAASITSTYTWERSTNGGSSWSPVSGATSSTLTIPSVDMTWNQNQFRAIATDQYGRTSTSNAATLTVGIWNPINLLDGWFNYTGGGGYAKASYTKTTDGVVMLKGLISCSGTPPQAQSQVIGRLPAGYRPYGGTLIFQTNSSSDPSTGQVSSRIDVQTDGDILLQYGHCSWTALDGIHFIAAGSPYLATNFPTPYPNNWTNYGGPFAVGSYITDATGRVHTQGLVGGGTATNGTVIVPLAANLRPPQYQHFTARNNGAGHLGYDTASGILAKGGPNSYQSLNVMYYPNTFNGWTNLSLVNGWAWYGSIFSTPQYTKSADGIVTLKGLIGGGADGSVIATLPSGYRPKERLILAAVQNAVAGRIDILPNGQIVSVNTEGNTWASLDSITFRAEQ